LLRAVQDESNKLEQQEVRDNVELDAFKEELKRKRQRNQELEARVQALKLKKAEADKRLAKEKWLTKQATLKANAKRDLIQAMGEDVDRLNARLVSCEKVTSDHEAMEKASQDKMESLVAAFKSIQLKDQDKAKQKDTQKVRDDLEKVRREWSNSTLPALESKVSERKDKLGKLLRQHTDFKDRIDGCQIKAHEEMLEKAKEDREAAKVKENTLEVEIETMRSSLKVQLKNGEVLEAKHQEQKKANQELSQKLAQTVQQKNDLFAELVALKAKKADLLRVEAERKGQAEELAKVRHKLAQDNNALFEMQRKIKDLRESDEEAKRTASENEAKQNELDSRSEVLDVMQKSIESKAQVSAKLCKTKNANSLLSLSNQSLASKISAKSRDVQQLASCIEEMKLEYDILKEALMQSDKSVEINRVHLEEQSEQVKDISAVQTEVAQLERQFELVKTENLAFQSNMNNMKNEIQQQSLSTMANLETEISQVDQEAAKIDLSIKNVALEKETLRKNHDEALAKIKASEDEAIAEAVEKAVLEVEASTKDVSAADVDMAVLDDDDDAKSNFSIDAVTNNFFAAVGSVKSKPTVAATKAPSGGAGRNYARKKRGGKQ